MLFIDKLRSNANAQIIVDATGSGGPYIKGFIMQDFAFGGRNSFNSALEAILGAKRLLSDVNGAIGMGTGAFNRAGGDAVSRTFSGGDSVSTWVGSDRPRFTIPMLFLAINEGDDPRQTMRDLVQFVYPTGNPNTMLYAPLKYSPSFGDSGDGCCSIKIGSWFATPRLFVVKSVEMTISQRTDPQGVPLYVGAVMEFESQRTLTADLVQQFFT